MNKIIQISTFLGSLVLFLIIFPKSDALANFISNPSVEIVNPNNKNLPLDWATDNYGTNQPIFTYPTAGQEGIAGVKVELKSRSSGDAKWSFKEIPVTAGTTYTFSDYYQSNINNLVVAQFQLADNSYEYIDMGTNKPASSWTKITTTVVAPANANTLTIFHLIKKVGWLTTDNFSLVDNNPPPVPTPTIVPTIAITPTGTILPTDTPTLTPTNNPTNTPTPMVLPTSTPTPTTVVPTPTTVILPTSTPIITQTPTPTTIVPTSTPTPTPTLILVTPTNTPTPTAVPTVVPTTTPTPINGQSLILNPSFEISTNGTMPDNWLQGNWGTNTTQFIYPVAGQDGARAAKINMTSYTNGDAKWYFQDVPVTANSSYTFSDYYQSDTNTSVVVRFLNSTGAYSYSNVAQLAPSSSWLKVSAIFTVPAGIQSLTIFHLIGAVGSLSVDNYSLIPTPTPPSFSRGMVSLDFDDGWLSTYQNGLPILEAAGFKSTQYIITGYMQNAPGYVTAAQVVDMANRGHDVEAHTQTHPDLTTLTPAQVTTEIAGSRTDLINIGITPVSFAFPYGTWNAGVLQTVKNSGFLASRTALIQDGGYNFKNQDPYLLKTQDVGSATTLADVQSMINNAATTKTWVILVMHSVAGDGTQYDTPPAKLQSIVNYLKTSNVDVVTVKQGLVHP